MEFYCPICEVEILSELPSLHFRYTHMMTNDETVDILFQIIRGLGDRISNLYELLEIRERLEIREK